MSEENGVNPARERHPLWKLKGAGKEMYRELGGGETFIAAERSDFGGLELVE